ncbi:AAA family ATPase (plasmid) [Paenibacillus rhizovicinus]|uniref:AAA family ATPase n=1 Tax=Paenibacillus rhizovicinus TaxID=2704463 RepID=A0A6C0PBE5_9BACL|nr:DnaB-like helicase C-terminal domain-containing protein [Paenibacillus rhizovicinus]QHW35857.1 AAA family ATPase [Paenibacillus rhizovicinus]
MSNFEDLMRQMNEQMRTDSSVFVQDPNNPQRLMITDERALFGRDLNIIERQMVANILSMDNYAWSRGSRGGLATGFDLFDELIEGGAQPGLILFAAAPNVGKSALMLQICKQMAERNDRVYVSYHSLDDSNNELMPRYIACDQRITIAQAKMPERFSEQKDILEKRNEGLKNLFRRTDRFGMFDSNHTTSLEGMEQHIKDIIMTLPEGTRIVIAIDSFNDITVESEKFNNSDAKNTYVAKALKKWTVTYNAVVMCTAHLRKTGNKRPTVEDLKDTIELQYEANLICLLYSDVGVKEENAAVYWINEDEERKMPVIEMRIGKNKFGSFKGTRFYEFTPDWSYAVEAPIEDCRRYASLINQA